jgi:hypothetical protein
LVNFLAYAAAQHNTSRTYPTSRRVRQHDIVNKLSCWKFANCRADLACADRILGIVKQTVFIASIPGPDRGGASKLLTEQMAFRDPYPARVSWRRTQHAPPNCRQEVGHLEQHRPAI